MYLPKLLSFIQISRTWIVEILIKITYCLLFSSFLYSNVTFPLIIDFSPPIHVTSDRSQKHQGLVFSPECSIPSNSGSFDSNTISPSVKYSKIIFSIQIPLTCKISFSLSPFGEKALGINTYGSSQMISQTSLQQYQILHFIRNTQCKNS